MTSNLRFFTFGALSALAVTQAPAAIVYSMQFENAPGAAGLGIGDPAVTLAVGDTIPTNPNIGSQSTATVVGTGSSLVNVGTVSTAFMGGMDMEMGVVLNDADDAWLDSGVTLESMGIDANTDYTMAAWINYPSASGDRFVLGSESGNALHLGTRGDNFHSGHWSDDGGGGSPLTAGIDTWHYVVWTNDGTTGLQEIFVDGSPTAVASSTGAGGSAPTPNQNFSDLLIGGARNDTGRDFFGQIGGITVFDTVLSPAEQKAVALSVAVPEPARAALLGLCFLGALLRRRR